MISLQKWALYHHNKQDTFTHILRFWIYLLKCGGSKRYSTHTMSCHTHQNDVRPNEIQNGANTVSESTVSNTELSEFVGAQ